MFEVSDMRRYLEEARDDVKRMYHNDSTFLDDWTHYEYCLNDAVASIVKAMYLYCGCDFMKEGFMSRLEEAISNISRVRPYVESHTCKKRMLNRAGYIIIAIDAAIELLK